MAHHQCPVPLRLADAIGGAHRRRPPGVRTRFGKYCTLSREEDMERGQIVMDGYAPAKRHAHVERYDDVPRLRRLEDPRG